MESRIEKYYKDELNPNVSRSKKNQNLYKDIYGNFNSLDNLPIPDNTNEIDITKLKKLATSRDEYKKVKEYEKITNKNDNNTNQVNNREIKEEKIYDINELLENAKKNIKPEDKNSNPTPQYEYLEKLEGKGISNLDRKKEIYDQIRKDEIRSEEKERIVATKLSEEDQRLQDTASLSLDILSDLKPGNEPASSTLSQDIAIKDDMKEKKMENSAIFYSGSYSFSKNDFDNEFGNMKRNHYFLKFLLLLIGIGICCGIAYYYIKYYR